MKTKNLYLMMLLFGAATCNTVTCENDSAKDENTTNPAYLLVKDVSGIRIFTRWVPVDETRSGKEVKAEFFLEGTIAGVLSVLSDDKSFTRWMNGTKNYYRVRTVDDSHWFSYVQFAIPWPLNNQDCIIKYEVLKTPEAGKACIRMTGEPTCLRTFEGVKRIQHMVGSWTITDMGNRMVKVEYIMFSNQKPEFPQWITDPIVQNSLVKTMSALKNVVK